MRAQYEWPQSDIQFPRRWFQQRLLDEDDVSMTRGEAFAVAQANGQVAEIARIVQGLGRPELYSEARY
jgi:hypothetical protein